MGVVGYEDAVSKFHNGVYSQAQFENEVARMETRNTDWFDLLTHDSFSFDYGLSISGGSEKVRYYSSIGYSDNDDVINNNSNKRYTLSSKIDFSLTDKFQASVTLSGYNITPSSDQSRDRKSDC